MVRVVSDQDQVAKHGLGLDRVHRLSFIDLYSCADHCSTILLGICR